MKTTNNRYRNASRKVTDIIEYSRKQSLIRKKRSVSKSGYNGKYARYMYNGRSNSNTDVTISAI